MLTEYNIWTGIKQRCLNPKTESFRFYGARGITVCDEWRDSFDAFYLHIGPRPSLDHSVDRIDNDGNYQPGNVRWATPDIQMGNRRKPMNLKPKPKSAAGAGFSTVLSHFFVNGQEHGAKARMAKALGVTRSAVDVWETVGIPIKHVPKLKQLTGLKGRQILPELAALLD